MRPVSRKNARFLAVLCAMSMMGLAVFLSSCVFSIFSRKEKEAPEEFVQLYRRAGASEQVALLLARRETRAAIFRIHEDEQMPMREAMGSIKQILQRAHLPENLAAAGIPESVIAELRRGNKLAAIKAYLDEKHVSLREAKEAVEYIQKS